MSAFGVKADIKQPTKNPQPRPERSRRTGQAYGKHGPFSFDFAQDEGRKKRRPFIPGFAGMSGDREFLLISASEPKPA